MTPPKGKDFLQKIEHMLEREKNWVRIIPLSICLAPLCVCVHALVSLPFFQNN